MLRIVLMTKVYESRHLLYDKRQGEMLVILDGVIYTQGKGGFSSNVTHARWLFLVKYNYQLCIIIDTKCLFLGF